MRIQHNIMAMNAYRNFGNNTSALSKNLEKLSSGYKINRAGDDAAGLAISEKMRAQITGLKAAQKNVKDGISLVKTAEGAMQEIHDMLNRMDYLATQSANGTYDNEVDRANLQKEVESLKSEIDRISKSANFNGQKLLNGELGGSVPTVSAMNGSQNIEAKFIAGNKATGTTAAAVTQANTHFAFESLDANGNALKVEVQVTAGKDAAETAMNAAKAFNANSDFSKYYTASSDKDGKLTFTAKNAFAVDANSIKFGEGNKAGVTTTAITGAKAGTADSVELKLATNAAKGDTITIGSKTYTMGDTNDAAAGTFADIAGLKALAAADGYTITGADLNAGTALTISGNGMGKALKLQIGDTSADYEQLEVKIDNMDSASLGIGDLDIGTPDGAHAAIDKIKAAINTVSATRGDLGAIQNRLEHTQNNLSVMTENIQDAESTIRDTDVAEEMMAYTKNNILIQSAQAMLAQANQVPQGVLQLMQ